MSFFKEVADVLNSSGRTGDGYNIIDYGGEAIYIEGIRRILSIEPQLMRFDCKKKVIVLCGEKLAVHEMEDGCAVIVGKIVSVTAEDKDAR